MTFNFNTADPVGDGFTKLDNNNIENQACSASAFFRNIKSELIININKADAVFGCVAWLSNADIISALASRENVSIVLSDKSKTSLSSDINSKSNWLKLKALANTFNHFHTLIHIDDTPTRSAKPDDAIRPLSVLSANALGYTPSEKSSLPLMHNKFLVFCKIEYDKQTIRDAADAYYAGVLGARHFTEGKYLQTYGTPTIKPYAVWTGSFNFSSNAESSLENAVLIYGASIAEQYFKEFSQIYLLSQPVV